MRRAKYGCLPKEGRMDERACPPNILIDRLPETVPVGGRGYSIRTDFRIFILFELLWQDPELEPEEKMRRSLLLCYPEVPGDRVRAVEALLWFYRCGREESRRKQEAASRHGAKRIYSFDHDAGYIYAAFLAQYGMDLQEVEYLHWWKFRALFHALSEQTEFVKIMGYRSIDISDDMSNSQKAFYRRMKRIHALPLPKEEEEIQDAIVEALMNGGDLAGILGKGGGTD